MGKIFVASREAFSPQPYYQHTYLVYDADGNARTKSDQKIISLQKSETGTRVEADRPIGVSSEKDTVGDPHSDLNYTTVHDGADAALKWQEMVNIAKSLGVEQDDSIQPGYKIYIPEHTYNLDTNDCHTLTNTVLSGSGKGGLLDNLPKIGGDEGNGEKFPANRFPGGDGIIATSQNDTLDLTNTKQESVLDQGGSDTYVIDAGADGRSNDDPMLTIIEDTDLGTADKIVLTNIDPSELRYARIGNDLYIYFPGDDRPDVRIMGQFEGAKVPSIFVYPTGIGGTPTIVPLTNPNNFSNGAFDDPKPLPEWLIPPSKQYGDSVKTPSPLVLDLDGDGVEVTRLGYDTGGSTAYFDLDNDGFAERTAWVTGGDGLLVRDVNSNGKIDNKSELFGDTAPYSDGFAHLRSLDSDGSNTITSADSQWTNLRVWADADADGLTDAGELKTLAELGITAISLNATAQPSLYRNENAVSHTSTYTINGISRVIEDVWFRSDAQDTIELNTPTLNVTTLFLPMLKGFGTLSDLHVQMSRDTDLLQLVQNFAFSFTAAKLAEPVALNAEIEAILFKWAGIESVDPDSIGGEINAQYLSFMEKITGVVHPPEFRDTLNGRAAAALEINHSYESLFASLKAQLLIQLAGPEFFNDEVSYDVFAGKVTGGVLSSAALADLTSGAATLTTLTEKLEYWKEMVGILLQAKRSDQYTAPEILALDTAISAALPGNTWASVSEVVNAKYFGIRATGSEFEDYIFGTELVDRISGGGGNDTIYGYGDHDTLAGDNGADKIYGGVGSDRITGGNGDDFIDGGMDGDNLFGEQGVDQIYAGNGDNVINGGIGNDQLYSGNGYDTYQYNLGDGFDVITDDGGRDGIVLGDGFISSDVTLQVSGADLILSLKGVNAMQIKSYQNGGAIEFVVISDGTKLHIMGSTIQADPTVTGSVINGTSGNNNLLGTSLNDVIYGFEGNDSLNGAAGVDKLVGGLGNDTYIVDQSSEAIVENLNEGTDQAISSVSFILGNNLENLSLLNGAGIGDINATGNALNNTLTGNSQNNILDGKGGTDILIGFEGDDTFIINDTNDIILEIDGEGYNDTVIASVNYVIGFDEINQSNIENLILVGSATSGTGNSLMNTITGNDLDNILDGGENYDTLIGGLGNDIYVVDMDYEAVIEVAGQGTDTVRSIVSGTYLLADNVENLVFYDTNTTYGIGNALNNSITGNSGNDFIDGALGADTMSGGLGNDTYYVDNVSDVVTESASQGSDEIRSGVTYTLPTNVEYLILTGAANINATGNSAANTLNGNSGSNILSGGGGNDSIFGLGGADTFQFATGSMGSIDTLADYSSAQGDKIDVKDLLIGYVAGTSVVSNFVEITTSGSNSILRVDRDGTASAYGWSQIATILNVTGMTDEAALVTQGRLVVSSGTAAINGTANDDVLSGTIDSDQINGLGGNDTINGLDSNDTLDGGAGNDTLNGGAGSDTMLGGSGDDIYIVDNVGDVLTELIGGGADLIQSSVTYTVAANVENLTLTGTSGLGATGNNLANTINGNSGNNTLNGDAGNDTLYGNAGADTVNGGDGNDALYGGSSNDILRGDAGNDYLNGNSGNDTLSGGLGNDAYVWGAGYTADQISDFDGTNSLKIIGLTKNEIIINVANASYSNQFTITSALSATDVIVLTKSAGVDSLIQTLEFDNGDVLLLSEWQVWQAPSSNLIEGDAGGVVTNDTLTGTAGVDTVRGFAGNDTLSGLGANDTLEGGIGNDSLDGGSGVDTMVGGAGDDTYIVDDAADVVTELSNEGIDLVQSSVTYALAANIENLTLTGVSAINGTGNTLNNIIVGSSGNNTIEGGAGNDTMAGGDGVDTLSYASATAAVTVNLSTTTAQNTGGAGTDTVSGFENLRGSAYNDTLTGDANANVIEGGAGNDTIASGLGGDTMSGGTGDDTYSINETTDLITENLNEGIDTVQSSLTYTLAANIEKGLLTGSTGNGLTGNALDNELTGNGGINTLTGGDGADLIYGNGNTDYLWGGNGNDALYGGSGNDVMHGEAGNDTLTGGTGNDDYYGEAGLDILIADEGTDELWGGADADVFKFASTAMDGPDYIRDYNASQNDVIDVKDLLFGYDPLTSLITNFVEMTNSGANTIMRIDRDGAGTSYTWAQAAQIDGVTGMTDEQALLNTGKLIAA